MISIINGRLGGLPRAAGCGAALLALGLGGCTAFSPDGGFDGIAGASRTHLGQDVKWARTPTERSDLSRRVGDLLKQPLAADEAVQVALLNNGDLQAAFEELGISEADMVQASRLPNPKFTLRDSHQAAQYDIEQTLTFNVLSLATVPYAKAVERRRFEQTQSEVLLVIVELAARTRAAYTTAVAAGESARYWRQVKDSADAGAELANRMVAAGNWNQLDQAREQGFYAEATQGLDRAQLAAAEAREELTQLLGLSDPTQLQLAERLPDLPAATDELPDVEQTAMQGRLDLKVMKSQTEALAKSLGLVRTTRFINVLNLGPTRVLDGPHSGRFETGVEVSLEIPLFDSGAARLRRAEALYAQAVDRFGQAAVRARSDVRKAYARYRTTYDIAKHQRDDVVPLRQRVAAQNRLRYNGMLVSVFDLLADARAQIDAVNDYIHSARDFWIAKSELDAAMLGGSPSAAPMVSAAAAASAADSQALKPDLPRT